MEEFEPLIFQAAVRFRTAAFLFKKITKKQNEFAACCIIVYVNNKTYTTMNKHLYIFSAAVPAIVLSLASCSDKKSTAYNQNERMICMTIISIIDDIQGVGGFDFTNANQCLETNLKALHSTTGAALTEADKAELRSLAFQAGVAMGQRIQANRRYHTREDQAQLNRLMHNLQEFDSFLGVR